MVRRFSTPKCNVLIVGPVNAISEIASGLRNGNTRFLHGIRLSDSLFSAWLFQWNRAAHRISSNKVTADFSSIDGISKLPCRAAIDGQLAIADERDSTRVPDSSPKRSCRMHALTRIIRT